MNNIETLRYVALTTSGIDIDLESIVGSLAELNHPRGKARGWFCL